MQAAAMLLAVGLLLLILVGGAALVWLCFASQRHGTDFKGELRTRMFVYRDPISAGCADHRPRGQASRVERRSDTAHQNGIGGQALTGAAWGGSGSNRPEAKGSDPLA